jgi:hypothetical protein
MTKKKLSKREMRLAIAKDVLKQLKLRVYWAKSTYFRSSNSPLNNQERLSSMNGAQVQKAVKDLASCEVCAIGAAIVSGVRLYDGVKGHRFDPGEGALSWAGQRFFTEHQLDMMEGFFEACTGFSSDELERKVENMPHRQRMEIVFGSIAKNDGRVVKKDILNRFQKARVE